MHSKNISLLFGKQTAVKIEKQIFILPGQKNIIIQEPHVLKGENLYKV